MVNVTTNGARPRYRYFPPSWLDDSANQRLQLRSRMPKVTELVR